MSNKNLWMDLARALNALEDTGEAPTPATFKGLRAIAGDTGAVYADRSSVQWIVNLTETED